MKPKRIILIRHGESEGNVNKSIYSTKPDYTLELTSKGVIQAYEGGKELKEIIKEEKVFCYVSPMWRTRMTFEMIAKFFHPTQIDFVEEPRLREQEWGHFRDVAESAEVERIRDSYGSFYYRIPEGESAVDAFDRVSDFFGTLHRDFEKENFPENVLIVTHGMLIRLFLMRWFHWTVEEFEEYANPKNCQIVIMEINEKNKFVLKSNLAKHDKPAKYRRPIRFEPGTNLM